MHLNDLNYSSFRMKWFVVKDFGIAYQVIAIKFNDVLLFSSSEPSADVR